MSRLAVIGAGMSGLAAAWTLRAQPIAVTIFEKSRGYSGRATTRGKYGARYDHGANYIVPSTDRVRHLIFDALPTDRLTRIEGEVWTFDAEGEHQRPSPDEAESDGGGRWTYDGGINTIGKLMARGMPATTNRETRIQRLHRSDDAWMLTDTDGGTYGPFDAVLLTPPAPQTAALLRETTDALRDDALREAVTDLLSAVETAEYLPQFAYIFGYEREIDRTGPYYGLVNEAGDHNVAWIGFEHDKPGRVPDGHSVIVVQMSPNWTARRVDEDPDRYVADVKEMAASVLDADLKRPEWYDTQRWRYSMPRRGADAGALRGGAEIGLYFAGDDVAGTGRVDAALESGLDAGEQILAAFGEPAA